MQKKPKFWRRSMRTPRKTSNIFMYIALIVLLVTIVILGQSLLFESQIDYQYNELPKTLQFDEEFIALLRTIAVPRAVGSRNHTKVGNRIVSELKTLNWHLEEHNFTDRINNMRNHFESFRNIIGYANRNAEKHVVLACHYDSLNMKHFVGAIDSAIPCAMILFLARALRHSNWNRINTKQKSLTLVFFDGEEAFYRWSSHDSIYGSRNLAQKWHKERFLEKIDLFILLDLIGHRDVQFCNYFEKSNKYYELLSEIEWDFKRNGLLSDSRRSRKYFVSERNCPVMLDDHLPFLQRNVPVLHLIPKKFPVFWHTLQDDLTVFDRESAQELIFMLGSFLLQIF